MIASDLLGNSNLSSLHFPVPHLQCLPRRKISAISPFLPRQDLGILKLGCFGQLRFHHNPKFQVYAENDSFSRLEVYSDDTSEMGDSYSLVELIATHTLAPALTYMQAVDRMRAAIEELKSNPPDSRSGVLRFQVALPPSTKALNWLCHQRDFLVAFPQFYLLRKQIHEPFFELDGMLGVSGIGAAICFHGSSSTLKGYNLIARYLSIDSSLIRAYGFIGINCNKDSSMIEDNPGCFYFFIPQIELNEFVGCSLLASTLVWDDTLSYTFEKAIHSFELHLHQIIRNGSPIIASCQDILMNAIDKQSYLINDKELQMVYLNAEILEKGVLVKCLQQEEKLVFYQYYFRQSAVVSFSANMFTGPRVTSFSIEKCANINLLWASLIVEECVRLGLTYFCIAPGSRSSPLAISACDHSLTTCVSCFDERSLAFHAVGYGRGSHKPAVVITSSGTAVSNLLPAVVEASHDFVPLLLLTADRPPELQDAGANQAIDQVNHFGKFVRFFFSLPPPTDQVPARMVLTTIDSAAYSATRTPYGPVHINCPFREPLEDFPREWTLNCLRGLDLWKSKSEPFTKYIRMQQLYPHNYFLGQMAEVLEVIQRANQGLLLVGAIHTEDEIWAALLLSKYLSWPTVTDVLSGLRLRRVVTSFPDIDDQFLFIDHLDQALLSDSVKCWAKPDVVVQIGSRITSKRLAQLLESCSSCSYILVDSHPFRHDPSHIITHRIQSTITEFADILLKVHFPRKPRKWGSSLKALDMMVAREISFQIHSECLLTEPYVAHIIGEVLHGDSALFIGNSMVIRDVDMYGRGWGRSISDDNILMSYYDVFFQGMQVAGNRGASGIDGLLSTAIGFAVGCQKRVLCMIGDISFLHDTNGLAILNQRIRRKPITVLVINNHGGAIFSLLPIANRARPNVLHQYFYTSHDVSVSKLCAAHSVKHLLVRTKFELQHALRTSQQEQTDCIIEVESCIADNMDFHRSISKAACQAANHAMSILLGLPLSEDVHDGVFTCKIQKMEYSLYRIELCAPPTSSRIKTDSNRFYREGFILSLSLDDKSVGFGEVAPIEIHKEDLLDVEEQLRFLLHIIEGSEISYLLPSLNGSFSQWIWRSLGIPPSSIFPSVRCGIEMAVLNALAARQGSSLFDVISGIRILPPDTRSIMDDHITINRSEKIQICALVDCNGTPKEVAHVVSELVDEGFKTIKLKVARRENPIDDAIVIQEIRETVGYKINIRVDANRRWTYEEAVQFESSVKYFDLQYIEEPVCLEDDIIKFCEQSSLPVALDETIDNLQGDILHKLKEFIHPRIVAVVIKPSVVGGFENAARIAKWAQLHEKIAVLSGAFESSLSLSAYIQFAHYLEKQNATICKIKNRELNADFAHGLGTYRWLKEDLTKKELKVCVPSNGDSMEASVQDAHNFLRDFEFDREKIQRIYTGEQVRSHRLTVHGVDFFWSVKLQEVGANKDKMIVIFLHGFLGTCQDWIPIMKALSTTARCISIDLPGHGESKVQWHTNKRSNHRFDTTIESVAHLLLKLICDITTERVILVGYSMGARISLYMAMKYNDKIDRAIIISGSPGLRNEQSRQFRRAQDESRARYLLSCGLQCFLKTWYAGKLWKSFRDHPHFKEVIKIRAKHHDIYGLAKSLTDLSIGRQMPLWEDLKHCKTPLLLIAGEKDTKFKEISQQICAEINGSSEGEDRGGGGEKLCEMIVVPDCGHAVHLENPLPVINALRTFLSK